MKRTSACFSLFLFLVLLSSGVWAACHYNGKDYPVGTVLDGKICTSNGWKNL